MVSIARGSVGLAYAGLHGDPVLAAPFVRRSRRQRRAAERRAAATSFRALHSDVAAGFLRTQRPFWRLVSQSVLGKLRQAGTVNVTVEEIFQPRDFLAEFNRRLMPDWANALYLGVQFEAEWIGERDPQQSLLVRQDINLEDLQPPPSFHVDLSPAMQARLRNYLKERERGVWSQVGSTVHDRLRRALQRGLKEGDSFDDMQERVAAVMKGQADHASRRIARTETTGGMNYGQQLERDELGITNKGWVATIDVRTRGAGGTDAYNHLAADGLVVPNDGVFVVSGQKLAFPGDSSHGASAGNVINCRCTAVAEFDEGPTPQGSTPSAKWEPPPEAESIKAAEQIAREHDLAETINYKGLSVETANAINRTLAETIRDVPLLRPMMRFVGSMQERNKYFVRKYADQQMENLSGRTLTAAERKEYRKYFEGRARKMIGRVDQGTMAQAITVKPESLGFVDGISINSQWGGRPEAWRKVMERDVASGFHPVGTASAKAVIDHEIAHKLDELLGLADNAGIKHEGLKAALAGVDTTQIEAGLSKYAGKNAKELIAEAWSEFKNADSPRQLALTIGRLIEAELRKLSGS